MSAQPDESAAQVATPAPDAEPRASLSPMHAPGGDLPGDDEPRLPFFAKDVTLDQLPGAGVPMDTPIVNSSGERTTLGAYFADGKPVILNLGYYACPSQCNLLIVGMAESIAKMSRDGDWLPGQGYRVLTLSIDPREDALAAAEKRDWALRRLAQEPGVTAEDVELAREGWVFATVETEAQARAIADAVGWKYVYRQDVDQFAHPTAIVVLNGQGAVYRYFMTHAIPPRDLRLSLVEASEGKAGNIVDLALGFCFTYSDADGTYVKNAKNLMMLGGAVTLLVLSCGLLLLFRLEKKRGRAGRSSVVDEPGSGRKPLPGVRVSPGA
ncbi:MAG: SCO family protein [Planctomycetota bacterium]